MLENAQHASFWTMVSSSASNDAMAAIPPQSRTACVCESLPVTMLLTALSAGDTTLRDWCPSSSTNRRTWFNESSRSATDNHDNRCTCLYVHATSPTKKKEHAADTREIEIIKQFLFQLFYRRRTGPPSTIFWIFSFAPSVR